MEMVAQQRRPQRFALVVIFVLFSSVLIPAEPKTERAVQVGLPAAEGSPTNGWPCWRGPNAAGVADGRKLPLRWSRTENVRWSVKLPGWGTSSPVVYYRGLLYALLDNGVLVCLDGKTGQEQYRERLGAACNSSPIACDGRIYVSDNTGTTFVVQAGRQYRLLATNELDERVTASPAISGNELIYRTDSQLFCLGLPLGQ